MGVIADADTFRELCCLLGRVYDVTLRQGEYGFYVETMEISTDSSYHSHCEGHTSSGKTLHEALRKAIAGEWDEEELWPD